MSDTALFREGSATSDSGTATEPDDQGDDVAHDPAELRRMTDEELIHAYREERADTAGLDPDLTLPEDEPANAIREEMQRRGLAPDREDIVPAIDSHEQEPVVEDRA